MFCELAIGIVIETGGNMSKFSRRQFAAGLAAGSALLAMPAVASGARPKVVVVGGGAVVQLQHVISLRIVRVR